MNTVKITFFLIFLWSINETSAQASDTGGWFAYTGSQSFYQKWNWHNEVQYRNYNLAGDLQQLLLRTGIGYDLSENNNNVLLGYAYVLSENYIEDTDEKFDFVEHRVFQQFITKQNFNRLFLQHRYRLEERFFSDDYKTRFRYAFMLTVPMNSKVLDKNTFYTVFSDELFLGIQKEPFDQNRLYGGIGYFITKSLKIETGFMRQNTSGKNRNQFQISFFNTLPL